MSALFKKIIAAAPLAAMPALAHAHLGHAGELAGHSHWLGLGALVAAAAALALLPKKRRPEDEKTAADAEPAGEAGEEDAA